MSLGYALVAVGVVLFALGYARVRAPWSRYRELKARDANAARYRAWRGGPPSAGEERTGAAVAMALLRREARAWATVAVVGVAFVVVGFLLAA
ncbi:MAG: hypothetical protein M0T75_01350 [Chloroflexi bacterium]|nr:hypothetical protein [Chloroflexota bacterium]